MSDTTTKQNLDDFVFERVTASLATGSDTSEQKLVSVLRYLGKWRQAKIDAIIARTSNQKVLSGPFAGMAFVRRGTHGSLAPKLLGTYESELHHVIEAIITTGYETLLNIGSAEGYYAVGLARRMPNLRVFAYDTSEKGLKACLAVAQANGVAERLTTGGLFRAEDFAAFASQKTLVLCDIEGGERDLIDPSKAPALASFDILVECHDCFVPGLSTEIAKRFAPSHHIERIEPAKQTPPLPPGVSFQDEFDRLIAVWEWRLGPTPWLWMRSRNES